MSEASKKARAAMKAKAKRLTSDRPLDRVDSSTWTPPAMEKAGVKTGMRPVSPRAYKRGGKVMGKVHGEEAVKRADRAPRKAGGKAEMPTVDRFINRDLKKANAYRDGEKHIGGMKKGGRIGRENGGPAPRMADERVKNPNPSPDYSPRTDPNYKPDDDPSQSEKDALARMSGTTTRKSGGRTKKMDGGQMGALMGPVGGANRMMQQAAGVAGVPSALMGFNRGSSRLSKSAGLKKGGKAEGHPDEAADKALIKKMVKPEARTGKKHGGEREARATGGHVFSGSSYPGKVPGAVPGGRTARADGGAAKRKGKTDINIVINAEKGGAGAGMMPPGVPPGGAPKGMPVPVPPAPGGMPPGMPMGMMPGMMPPGGAPPMAPPPGGAPMPRKSGGRTYRSYKDMDAGAGGAKGREEKTEIASKHSGIQKQNY